MFKKIIIGILVFSVLGAGGAALAYNTGQQENEPQISTPEPLASSRGNGNQQNNRQTAQAGSGEPAIEAQGGEGEPWQAVGIIAGIDDYGFDFIADNGESVYIELGPPDYWQSQGVALEMGQQVVVSGSINDGMIHATQVSTADGQVLALRSASGQPLWSGGAANSQGQNGSQGDGDHVPEPMADVDRWVTLEGTLMSFQGGNMTMGTPDGAIIAFQTGQPRFFAEQGVTFQVGDEITLLGFYEGDQFMAGEITQVATGARVMLRDPNGRPLWAGPGNGNGNGSGGSNNGKGGNQGNVNGGHGNGGNL